MVRLRALMGRLDCQRQPGLLRRGWGRGRVRGRVVVSDWWSLPRRWCVHLLVSCPVLCVCCKEPDSCSCVWQLVGFCMDTAAERMPGGGQMKEEQLRLEEDEATTKKRMKETREHHKKWEETREGRVRGSRPAALPCFCCCTRWAGMRVLPHCLRPFAVAAACYGDGVLLVAIHGLGQRII